MKSIFIPKSLKRQQIAPIHKKGDKSVPENYRPVILTSYITKTIERVVGKHMVKLAEETGIFNEEQHGFRAGRICLNQLLQHHDAILDDLNQGKEVDVAYIDYAKAFDKVDIHILLENLHRYGFRGTMLKLIRAFLTGRSQTVVVDEGCSRSESVNSSVIQGSVFGPLLFIICIANLAAATSGGTLTFADDTKIRKAIELLMDKDYL